MNLVTPARRAAAAREVRDGIAFACSLPLDLPGGSAVSPTRHPPRLEATVRPSGEVSYHHRLSSTHPGLVDVVSDDRVTLWTQYSTQWDALSHWGQEFDADGDGHAEIVYYNGYRAGVELLGPADGGPRANRLGIETLAVSAVQGRGVLVDLASVHGESPATVGYDSLMHTMARQGAVVEQGDFLCLYTGWADLLLAMAGAPVPEKLRNACAALDGSDERLLQWVADSGVVAICADNQGVERLERAARPGASRSSYPLHELCLFKQGIFLGEMWLFADLARHLSRTKRTRFLLTAPPLRLPGAVGSPVTPVATA